MRVDVVTIFPSMYPSILGESILKRAQTAGLIQVVVHDLRDSTHDKRRTVDDRPYGGGPGMVMKPEPIFEAVEAIERRAHGTFPRSSSSRCQIILMAPQGERLTQALAKELSTREHLVIICGHYEGVDERIRQTLIDREVSIGDYVLTGGELPSLVVIDCVARLIPRVLGHAQATVDESFRDGLLEYPQYTRPPVFRGIAVPEVLRSGDHEGIATWRKLQALARTLTRRPDLLDAPTRTSPSTSCRS